MAQEGVTDQIKVLVLPWESALVDYEVAFALIALVEILLWSDLEYIVTHLESDWLHFLRDVLARRLNVAECLVAFAIQLWQAVRPLLPNLLKYIWWYRKLRASSIYYSWIARVLTWLLHGLGSISHALSLESPCSKPVGEVLESLEAVSTIDNLRGVVSSEESVGRLVHLLGGNTEADHGVIDDTVVLEGPEVVQLLLAHVFVW